MSKTADYYIELVETACKGMNNPCAFDAIQWWLHESPATFKLSGKIAEDARDLMRSYDSIIRHYHEHLQAELLGDVTGPLEVIGPDYANHSASQEGKWGVVVRGNEDSDKVLAYFESPNLAEFFVKTATKCPAE